MLLVDGVVCGQTPTAELASPEAARRMNSRMDNPCRVQRSLYLTAPHFAETLAA
jgi:hypothetical protein